MARASKDWAAWGKFFACGAKHRHRLGHELVRKLSLIIPDSEKHQ